MIRFDLICGNDHAFDSWFRSSTDCESLLAKKLVTCTTCGTSVVRKALMAPKVSKSKAVSSPDLTPDNDLPLARLKQEIERTADDVGQNFATEARAMHSGDKPERAIYGQTSGDEAKKLIEDGVPVMPLPFIPTKKTN